MSNSKQVYVILQYDIESSYIKAICSTKKKAEKLILKHRDELVEGWQKSIDFIVEDQYTNEKYKEDFLDSLNSSLSADDAKHTMQDIEDFILTEIEEYQGYINNLSGNDYTKWDNGVQECLTIREYPLL